MPSVVTREAVLDTLRAYGTWASIPEVADRIGGDRRAVARVVGQLLAAGAVVRSVVTAEARTSARSRVLFRAV